jgi:hypothetical protein
MIIAIACFSVVRLIKVRNDSKRLIRTVVVGAIAVVMTLSSTFIITNHVLVKEGLLLSDITRNVTNVSPFVVGTNNKTKGEWSIEDAKLVNELPPDKQIELVLSRLSETDKLPRLFYDKGRVMWLDPEGSFYKTGYHAYLERIYIEDESFDTSLRVGARPMSDAGTTLYNSMARFVNGVLALDSLFVIALYMFMIVGLFALKNNRRIYAFEIAKWNIAGWILLRIFAEVQPRYRYLVIPYIVLMASVGIVQCIDYLGKRNLLKNKPSN